MVANLTAGDFGPKSKTFNPSNWNKKTISISTNKININFISGDLSSQENGFIANLYFVPIPNKECESWLDMDKKVLKSPNHSQHYYNSMKCSWLITIDHDNHITLDLKELYVRHTQVFEFKKCIQHLAQK